MHPVLILTHNNLSLTKRCVESLEQQDIPVEIYIYDNASTDGTPEWIMEHHVMHSLLFHENRGVSEPWNRGLNYLFNGPRYDHVLVVNNDTQFSPWFYRSLLEYEVGFVTGVSVNTLKAIAEPQPRKELVESPDFSAFLIRKEVWDKVGKFNEDMVSYCSDCDFHVRAHRLGIPLWNSGIHFYHERSSTIKNADKRSQRELQLQADADREAFKSIYGCLPWEDTYSQLFK